MQQLLLPALISALSTYLVPQNAEAAGNEWGVWTNNEKTHTYAFLKNNELKFWGLKWLASMRTPAMTDGVWQHQEGLGQQLPGSDVTVPTVTRAPWL